MERSHKTPGPTPSKRRKIAESCKPCRAKKTRCDGTRPQCSPCVARAVACEYNSATVSVTADMLSDLEARIRRLEGRATTATPSVTVTGSSSHGAQISWNLQSNGVSAQPASAPSVAGVDWADARPIVDPATTRFIHDIAAHQLPKEPQVDWPIETDYSAMVMPDRSTADDLVNCYERHVYPLFPLLHMPTFYEKYQRIWQASGRQFDTLSDKVTFYAILNIVLAIGCLSNSCIDQQVKQKTADAFYRRARALRPLDALDVPSMDMVQCLLLTTIYLASTKYTSRCCNALAVAIRLAQTLGLHLPAEPESTNQLVTEITKRVWLYPIVYGQIAILGAADELPLPESIDDDHLMQDGAGVQPSETPSLMGSFIASIRIFQVVDQACKMNYNSFAQTMKPPELSQVLHLNERVDDIEGDLPSHLRLDTDKTRYGARSVIFQLQAEAVNVRIFHVRLILLRPNILAAARHAVMPSTAGQRSSLGSPLHTELAKQGVQAAVSAIEVLYSNLRSESNLFSALAVYVTMSATTVIVAASLVPELEMDTEGDGIYGRAVIKAAEVLEGHRWQSDAAAVAKVQLEEFMNTAREAKLRAMRDPQISHQPGFAVDMGDIDFSNPLWDFSWAGPYTLLDMAETSQSETFAII